MPHWTFPQFSIYTFWYACNTVYVHNNWYHTTWDWHRFMRQGHFCWTITLPHQSFKWVRCVWWSPARTFSPVQHDVVHTPWRSWLQALLYNPEGYGFAPRLCHRNLSFTSFFRLHYGRCADSAYKRNAYQEYFLGCKGGRCARLTLLPSFAGCVVIWKLQPPGYLKASPGL
jgi:hypothetical protein